MHLDQQVKEVHVYSILNILIYNKTKVEISGNFSSLQRKIRIFFLLCNQSGHIGVTSLGTISDLDRGSITMAVIGRSETINQSSFRGTSSFNQQFVSKDEMKMLLPNLSTKRKRKINVGTCSQLEKIKKKNSLRAMEM